MEKESKKAMGEQRGENSVKGKKLKSLTASNYEK